MIDKMKNIFKNLSEQIKNNFKTIISILLGFILIIIIYQIYLFKHNQKILELSILYDEAKTNIGSDEFDRNMNLIAQENGIFGILASLELINYKLDSSLYNESYIDYLNLLNTKDTDNIYRSIIALHGAYNLIDYVSSEKIRIFLPFIDKTFESFIGYRYEILYLLSVKDNNIQEKQILYNEIINHDQISSTIKDRVQKINEFEKYK